ncbi:MAG: hypothetical protein R3C15_04260 [Thermoleophilia bacterium]
MEVELDRRGWPIVGSPADADLLVVCGRNEGDEVERSWADMSGPRARVDVGIPGDAARALDRAQLRLADVDAQRRDASARSAAAASDEDWDGRTGHGAHDDDGDRRAGHGDGDHEGGMEMPGGLPMADRAEDRDGLRLDRLHVALGPVLCAWPAGLVVRVALQGDVVQCVSVETVVAEEGEELPFWNEPWLRAAAGEPVTRGEAARRRASAHLDSLGRLLAVAGWHDAAVDARRLRDQALGGAAAGRLVPRGERLARRLRRSRALRWLTDGLGVLDEAAAATAGVSGPAARAGAT